MGKPRAVDGVGEVDMSLMNRKGARVLVVEDDFKSHYALTRIIRHVGYEVTAVETLAEGMAALTSQPHVVVLDLMLPDGPGTGLLAHIRQERLPIAVVITTAAVDPALLGQVHALRPDGFFRKPIEIPQLLAWLREYNRVPLPALA